MTKICGIPIGLIIFALCVSNVKAAAVDAVIYNVTVYADIVGKELVWAHEKSDEPDLQAIHSKQSGKWYFRDGKTKIEAKKLGTPWQTDGSTAGIFSSKSSVLEGYVASCITDVVGSSGLAGNFTTSYLVLKSSKKWNIFVFSTTDGCDAVELDNPKNVNFSYQKIDLRNPGRLSVSNVSVIYKNDEPILIQKSMKTEDNSLVRKYLKVVKNGLIR